MVTFDNIVFGSSFSDFSSAPTSVSITSLDFVLGTASCGTLFSRAYSAVDCNTTRVSFAPSFNNAPRFAEILETHDKGPPSTTCAPSKPSPNSCTPSKTTMTDHTLLSTSLFSRESSSRGFTPKPHRSDDFTFSHALRPSSSFAVDANLWAHLPLCATTTKSYVPNCFALSLSFEANAHSTTFPSSSRRTGCIAPTHCGRCTTSQCLTNSSDIPLNPSTPTKRSAPSLNAVKRPLGASRVPTTSSDQLVSAPASTRDLANDSRATSEDSVKYCNP
mmetsp:Transcript_1219/g.5065  ORF Transcript_1219/g.5065 Transcript_1219/m.5065 type:complete len:275 (-) Transcript_1219:221-1045(-)